MIQKSTSIIVISFSLVQSSVHSTQVQSTGANHRIHMILNLFIYLREGAALTLPPKMEPCFLILWPGSSGFRGDELARVDTSRRSWWSSLLLLRKRLVLSALLLLLLTLLMRLCDTTSSNRWRCFFGMKILANMTKTRNGKASNYKSPVYGTTDCLWRGINRLTGKMELITTTSWHCFIGNYLPYPHECWFLKSWQCQLTLFQMTKLFIYLFF